jgi:hypothetical protein
MIMVTRQFFKSIPTSKENSIDDIVKCFMECHRNACIELDMKSTYHEGHLEVSIGPYDSVEKRDPYLSIMHGSSWGFDSFEQVCLELFLPNHEFNNSCWFRVDSPADPTEEWNKFCKASGIIHCLDVKGCKYNIDFGSHDGRKNKCLWPNIATHKDSRGGPP